MLKSDIGRLFRAIDANGGVSYQEFSRDIADGLEIFSASGSSAPLEKPTEESAFQAEEELGNGKEAIPIPNTRKYPDEEGIASTPPDANGFCMLHFLSSKTPTRMPDITPKHDRRLPRVAVHSPLGGAGCSTIAAGLAWLLSNNNQSSLIVDLGGAGMTRLFFGMNGEELEGDAPWNATVGSMAEGSRLSGLLSAGRREAAALVETVLPWIDGGATPREAASLVDRIGRPDWVIFDVASARFDLLDILISQVDLVVVPLRVGLETVLAIEETQKEIKAAKLTKSGGLPQCLYILNQFEAKNQLHLEIARTLHQNFGALVAIQSIPRDPGLSQALAESKPFSSPLFVEHSAGILSLLLRWSLSTPSFSANKRLEESL